MLICRYITIEKEVALVGNSHVPSLHDLLLDDKRVEWNIKTFPLRPRDKDEMDSDFRNLTQLLKFEWEEEVLHDGIPFENDHPSSLQFL